jgi:hypothetical protein
VYPVRIDTRVDKLGARVPANRNSRGTDFTDELTALIVR